MIKSVFDIVGDHIADMHILGLFLFALVGVFHVVKFVVVQASVLFRWVRERLRFLWLGI